MLEFALSLLSLHSGDRDLIYKNDDSMETSEGILNIETPAADSCNIFTSAWLRYTSIPPGGSRNAPRRFLLQKPGEAPEPGEPLVLVCRLNLIIHRGLLLYKSAVRSECRRKVESIDGAEIFTPFTLLGKKPLDIGTKHFIATAGTKYLSRYTEYLIATAKSMFFIFLFVFFCGNICQC